MDIKEEIIKVFRGLFNGNIKDITLKDRCYEGDKRHYIYITDTDDKKIIIKCYKNNYNTEEKVEGFGYFTKVCNENGVKVPLLYKTMNNRYHTYLTLNNEKFLAWAEEFFPYKTLIDMKAEIKVTEKFFYKIGELVGQIHTVTKDKKVKFPWNSSMVLFDVFCEDEEFDENYDNAKIFYETLSKYEVNRALLEEIWSTYNKKRNEIEKSYSELPSGGVQGDLSPNNIMVDKNHNPVAIIDFNQSGDDVYVNDMLQWGIYLAFGYLHNKTDSDLMENFKSYFKGYTNKYKLEQCELDCINNLYNIIRPFRYEKVQDIIEKAKEGNLVEADKYLKWVLYELTREDIISILGDCF